MSRVAVALGVLAAVSGAAAAAGACAADASAVEHGRTVFQRVCAPCHGTGPGIDGAPMLPGAAALAAKYQGAVSPFLEQRADLTAAVLKYYVRHGSGAMPMFRKTEISDVEIEALAAYLAAAARGTRPGAPD